MTGVSVTVDRLLRTPGPQLDELFRQSPSDRTPAGDGDGTVIFAPGSPFSAITAGLVRLLAWKGKTFDPGTASLRNRMGPLGKQAIPAKVCHDASWLDANPAIILDYSRSALVARRIRDEIREVAPGVFLGIVYWNSHKVLRFALEFTNAERGRPTPHDMRSYPMKSLKNGSQAASKVHTDTAGGPTAREGGPGAPASPYRNSPFWRLYDALALKLDHQRTWYRLPKPLGLLTLIGVRNILRQNNLVDTTNQPQENPPVPLPYSSSVLTERTADGSWNDLDQPAMGMANTRFGRNVPIDSTRPDPPDRILEPNPREVSRRLMTRDQLIPASGGNALIAAWLQFMIRDWFSHGSGTNENPWILPIGTGDDWPAPQLIVPRTSADPTAPANSPLPPTYRNVMSHWWDGSQIYGGSLAEQGVLRSQQGGKLRIDSGVQPFPDDQAANPTLKPGFWLGTAMMQTLFALEHNAVCDRLTAAYPNWNDEQLFQRGRLITAALLAKIHTVEWTPAVVAHPTSVTALHANWYGLAGRRLHDVFGRISADETVSGIPGSATQHYGVPYALTEEFVAVYRMHPLIPDVFDFRAVADDAATLGPRPFDQLTGPAAVDLLHTQKLADLLYTFGTMNPGLVTLHNYPKHLQTFRRPDGKLMDLAATDILRSRELGVPRYTEFRRLLHLPVPRTFDELTGNPDWSRELSDVYRGDIDRVDLLAGMFAEPRPEGFAFSDTAFRIFVLMASRRLNSDRFFTRDFTPAVYTPEGVRWIDENTMATVLLRHCPELAPALRSAVNAFTLWPRINRPQKTASDHRP